MSKAVMISIQPKWCELIASRKKTIEVRKTRPKLETPFKCYIYCTLPKKSDDLLYIKTQNGPPIELTVGNAMVIGEFVCDYITPFRPRALVCDSEMCKLSCVPVGKLVEYAPDKPFPNDHIYGWHISDLVIYDRLKKLSEFIKPCIYGDDGEGEVSCFECEKSAYTPDIRIDCFNVVTRPPQSWCYVEEVSE